MILRVDAPRLNKFRFDSNYPIYINIRYLLMRIVSQNNGKDWSYPAC